MTSILHKFNSQNDKTLKFAAARVWPCISKQICRNSLLKCGNSTNTSIILLPSCHFSMVMDKIHHVTTSLSDINTSLLIHHYHLLGPLTDAQFIKRYKLKASSKMKVKNMSVLSSIAFNVNNSLPDTNLFQCHYIKGKGFQLCNYSEEVSIECLFTLAISQSVIHY